MCNVNIYEAKTNLSRYIELLESGAEDEIIRITNDLRLEMKGDRALVNDIELGNELRSMEVNKLVPKVAAITDVRLIIDFGDLLRLGKNFKKKIRQCIFIKIQVLFLLKVLLLLM